MTTDFEKQYEWYIKQPFAKTGATVAEIKRAYARRRQTCTDVLIAAFAVCGLRLDSANGVGASSATRDGWFRVAKYLADREARRINTCEARLQQCVVRLFCGGTLQSPTKIEEIIMETYLCE